MTVTLVDGDGKESERFYGVKAVQYDADKDRFWLFMKKHVEKVWAAGGSLKVGS